VTVLVLTALGFPWPENADCNVVCFSEDGCRSTRLRLRESAGGEEFCVSDLALERRDDGGM